MKASLSYYTSLSKVDIIFVGGHYCPRSISCPSCHVASCRLNSCHEVGCQVASCRLNSCHLASCHCARHLPVVERLVKRAKRSEILMFVYFEDWFDCGKCDLRMPRMTPLALPWETARCGIVGESPEMQLKSK